MTALSGDLPLRAGGHLERVLAVTMLCGVMAIGCHPTAAHSSAAKKTSHAHTAPRTHAPSAARTNLATVRAQEARLRTEREAEKARLAAAQQTSAQAAAQAAKDRAQATALSAATVTAAGQLQDTETQLQSLQERIDGLREEQARLRDELAQDARAIAPVLPLAQRLSLYPLDTLLAPPRFSDQTVTGLLVVKGLAASLEAKARAVTEHKAELVHLDQTLSGQLDRLDALRRTQQIQQKELAAQTQAAKEAQLRSNAFARESASQASQEAARTAALQQAIDRVVAQEASALAQLQREAEAAERARQRRNEELARRRSRATTTPRDTATSRETPAAPSPDTTPPPVRGGSGGIVAGRLVSAWGQTTEAGPASGNTYATAAGSSVRSPCAGTVEFAAPFRSYGEMLILNCGKGYRFVLAGLGTLNVASGQSLARGAAIGAMPTGGGSGSLMVQLRHGQQTVNPTPFL